MQPELVNTLLGPGGALILLAFISRGGFKFFTMMIQKQDEKYEKREIFFDELHKKTLEHINAHTRAVERLGEKIDVCAIKHDAGA